MEAKEVTFEQKQAEAYAFLDAYYTRADFGYDVKILRTSCSRNIAQECTEDREQGRKWKYRYV